MVRKSGLFLHQAVWSMLTLVFATLATVFFSSGFVFTTSAADLIDEAPPSSYPEEIVKDWKSQDGTSYDGSIKKIKEFIQSSSYPEFAEKISGSGESGYLEACHYRRIVRMKDYAPELKKLMYSKHHDIGGFIIGYTEDLRADNVRGLGDWGFAGMSRSEDYGQGGNSGIYLLEFNDYYPDPEVIVEDRTGVLRDPCADYDGEYIVYAHSKDNNGYHICEYNLETKTERQLTDNLGSINVSDYEPCVLPTGDIMFSSSRCFGHVDCNVNITSGIFLMNKDGDYMRRVGYDQVNTFYPTMMEDGQIMYTRWEYNDRNVANCFGIFTMYPDGSHQMEWFGNQTEWPATFSQARIIPGSKGMKALAVIGGHQGAYNGDLVLVDANKGRNNIGSVNCTQLIAPERSSSSSGGSFNMDGVPPEDKLFQNPYPLDDYYFLISFRKTNKEKFNVYLMDIEGNRELVAWDDSRSVSQPISLMQRNTPNSPQYQADYTKDVATVSVADVYYGDGIKGVSSGVERVRVVAMEYRTDPAFGNTGSSSYQMTPVGRFGASWEAKWIVGESPVASDGSASFEVPPDKPIFLQLIDKDGICIQTMRSWMTLKPGEQFECAGCHEDKNVGAPPKTPEKNAFNAEPLDKFYETSGEKGSFYYPEIIQPILDENCVKSGCHDESHDLNLTDKKLWTGDLDKENVGAYRYWNTSYYELSDRSYVNCNAVFGSARPISPRSLGSSRSKLITHLRGGHVDGLSEDAIPKLAAWIDLSIPHSGTYTDDMRDEDKGKYLERVARRDKQEAYEKENIDAFLAAGGYNSSAYTGVKKSNPAATVAMKTADVISVRFNIDAQKLSVRIPSEGKITLLDLQGRQVMAKTISKKTFTNNATQNFKLNVSSGTYIVKFDGVKVSGEEVVSLL